MAGQKGYRRTLSAKKPPAEIGRRVPGRRLSVSSHYPEEKRHDQDA